MTEFAVPGSWMFMSVVTWSEFLCLWGCHQWNSTNNCHHFVILEAPVSCPWWFPAVLARCQVWNLSRRHLRKRFLNPLGATDVKSRPWRRCSVLASQLVFHPDHYKPTLPAAVVRVKTNLERLVIWTVRLDLLSHPKMKIQCPPFIL